MLDAFGINEAVTYPALFVDKVDEDVLERAFDGQIAKLHWLGIRHVRVHSATYPFLNRYQSQTVFGGDRDKQDALLRRLLTEGFEPLVMLSVWPGNAPAAVSTTYVPDDVDAYAAWVTETVERYDGDGTGDAPDLPRGIHAWEYDNEPDLHHFAPPRQGAPEGFDPANFSTPAQFAQLAVRTAEAIHAADTDATVLPGGLWRPFDERLSVFADELYQQPGFAAAMSGLNVHAYPPRGFEALWQGLAHVQAQAPAGTPAWITETSISSLGRGGERVQAILLVEAFMGALRRGVVRLYWHSLTEAPLVYERGQARGTTGRHLFIGDEGDIATNPRGMQTWTDTHPKLAAWTLRLLLTELGGVPRSQVREVPVEGEALALAFGEDAWVVYSEGLPARQPVTLEVGARDQVTVTQLVPRESSGSDIRGGTAGQATFDTRTEAVRNGVVTLRLDRGPVLVRGR